MAPSSTLTKWVFPYWCSATRCTARLSSARWASISARKRPKTKPARSQSRPRKEINDEPERQQVEESCVAQGPYEDSAPGNARAVPRAAGAQLRRGESGIQRGTGAAGSPALPGMRQAHLYGQLSGGH